MTEAKSHRRILVSPLNWGLGHATRLIPIIRELTRQGHYVILAGEGASLSVLKDAFPELDSLALPGFNVSLSHYQTQWFKLLIQIPNFLKAINKEHSAVNNLLREHNIDLIISDNRYGLYSKQVASVIITHQTNPYAGKYFSWMRPLTKMLSTFLLNRFDECWIPDVKSKNNLSGSLSKVTKNLRYKFTGLLSRLGSYPHMNTKVLTDVLVILSGPEPQRTQLEEILVYQLKNSSLKTIILCAQPHRKAEQIGNIRLLPHCTAEEHEQLLYNSKYIICRSGYSTLMDLMVCKRTALLIPTPGQFEQEYLAQRATALFGFKTISQNNLKHSNLSDRLIPNTSTNNSIQVHRFNLPDLPLKK